MVDMIDLLPIKSKNKTIKKYKLSIVNYGIFFFKFQQQLKLSDLDMQIFNL